MSTRCSIKYSRPENGPGYHLFQDAWDGPDDPVELELFGVEAEVSTNGYARVVIPQAMARELGLLPASQAETVAATEQQEQSK